MGREGGEGNERKTNSVRCGFAVETMLCGRKGNYQVLGEEKVSRIQKSRKSIQVIDLLQ